MAMLPKEWRDSGQNDLFKSRLDQIVDMNDVLPKLARLVKKSGVVLRSPTSVLASTR